MPSSSSTSSPASEASNSGLPVRPSKKPQRSTQISPSLLTTRQVAERLNVSESHIRRMANAGELPRIRMRRSVRFHPADVTRIERAMG